MQVALELFTGLEPTTKNRKTQSWYKINIIIVYVVLAWEGKLAWDGNLLIC